MSAIIKSKDLDVVRPHFETGMALLLLALSVSGSIMAFNGGWANMLAGNATVTGIIAGLAVQLLCTGIEWMYRNKRLSFWYLAAFAVDVGTTLIGFGPVFYAPLARLIGGYVGTELQMPGAWLIIGLISALLAWIPEGRLIEQ